VLGSSLEPSLKVIYLSGATNTVIVRRGVVDVVPCMQKPFSISVLATKARETLDAAGPARSRTLVTREAGEDRRARVMRKGVAARTALELLASPPVGSASRWLPRRSPRATPAPASLE
jgi:hypothetical protein